MSFGDILYIVAIVLFVYLTFGIVRGYFKAKFDDEGRRKDMLEDKENKDKEA
jgi:ribose 5-phosphate isomerase RpiB